MISSILEWWHGVQIYSDFRPTGGWARSITKHDDWSNAILPYIYIYIYIQDLERLASLRLQYLGPLLGGALMRWAFVHCVIWRVSAVPRSWPECSSRLRLLKNFEFSGYGPSWNKRWISVYRAQCLACYWLARADIVGTRPQYLP